MQEIDENFQPIRALNDFLFCERRCALHRIEELWVDNAFTVEGTHGHQQADRTMDVQTAPGVRSVHAVLLRSRRLRRNPLLRQSLPRRASPL